MRTQIAYPRPVSYAVTVFRKVSHPFSSLPGFSLGRSEDGIEQHSSAAPPEHVR